MRSSRTLLACRARRLPKQCWKVVWEGRSGGGGQGRVRWEPNSWEQSAFESPFLGLSLHKLSKRFLTGPLRTFCSRYFDVIARPFGGGRRAVWKRLQPDSKTFQPTRKRLQSARCSLFGLRFSHLTFWILWFIPHTSHFAPHTFHLTFHTSHLTPPISHFTLFPYTSHLTSHSSHFTPHDSTQPGSDSCQLGRDSSQPVRDCSKPGKDTSQSGTDSSQPVWRFEVCGVIV